jgi:Uma2 family endonuclease
VDGDAPIAQTRRMGLPAERTKMSPQEYLAFERASEVKHEYADGEIFAMSGCTLEHSSIAANVMGELRNALRGRPCRVLTSDMRIHIPATGRYVYPDTTVVCGQPEFQDETRDVLLNPVLVVEVLSDSSEAYDRGDKFAQYRSLTSMNEYVLASQKTPRLEVFTRQPGGRIWELCAYGPGEVAHLASVGCDLAVDAVYEQVFEAGPAGSAA